MMRFEMLTGHATVLLVENVQRATDYYRDRLGFAVTIYEADPGLYGSAERDDCHVHFAHYDGASPNQVTSSSRPTCSTPTSGPMTLTRSTRAKRHSLVGR
jgi:catechol 2,3-dioxygenase-like lactoylglutathione lyase family enzyme